MTSSSSRKSQVQTLEITDGPSKSDLFRSFQAGDDNIIFADNSSPVEPKFYNVTAMRALPSQTSRRADWELEGTVRFFSSALPGRRFRMRYNTRTGKGKVSITELATK